MTKKEKLLAKLRAYSTDFTWNEAITVMQQHNFEVLAGKGSSRKFIHRASKIKVFVHEPHPEKIVKKYAQADLIQGLMNAGEIE